MKTKFDFFLSKKGLMGIKYMNPLEGQVKADKHVVCIWKKIPAFEVRESQLDKSNCMLYNSFSHS